MTTILLFLRFLVPAAWALVALTTADLAYAKSPPAVRVLVFSDDGELPPQSVRDALAKEMGGQVSIGLADSAPLDPVVTVSWRRSTRELIVSYTDSQRGTVTRVVDAPLTAREAADVAARLARTLADVDSSHGTPRKAPEVPPTVPTLPPVKAEGASSFPVNASLLYPLALNLGRPYAKVHVDVSILHSRIGQLEGMQIGTVNIVHRSVDGWQFGWGLNWVSGEMRGLQTAGAANWAAGSASGLQLALGFNTAAGGLDGGQVSWVNVARGGVFGAQLGGVNVATKGVTGLQAGGVNVAVKGLEGVQLGGTNVAGDVEGVQLGFINVAGKVRGVQLGLVNVSDEIRGVPFGPFSISKEGGVGLTAWATNRTYANVGVQFSTKYTYSIVSVGYHHKVLDLTNAEGQVVTEGAFDSPQVGPSFTFGVNVPTAIPLSFHLDAGIGFLFGITNRKRGSDGFYSSDTGFIRLRGSASYKFGPHFRPYVGAGVSTEVGYERLDEPRATDRYYHGSVTYRPRPEGFLGILF